MARTKINKSEAIRQAINNDPTATVSGIVAALAEQKLKVTPQLVSNVKSRIGEKPKKRGRKPGKTGSLTVAQLEAAAVFARSIGGIEQASAALESLARIRRL
jgi:hypothetical protein